MRTQQIPAPPAQVGLHAQTDTHTGRGGPILVHALMADFATHIRNSSTGTGTAAVWGESCLRSVQKKPLRLQFVSTAPQSASAVASNLVSLPRNTGAHASFAGAAAACSTGFVWMGNTRRRRGGSSGYLASVACRMRRARRRGGGRL